MELSLGNAERGRGHDLGKRLQDGVLTHQGPDPQLTPLGEAQARAINAGWKTQIADHAPVPQTLYSSPFRRAASTLDITWRDILLHKGVRPVVSSR